MEQRPPIDTWALVDAAVSEEAAEAAADFFHETGCAGVVIEERAGRVHVMAYVPPNEAQSMVCDLTAHLDRLRAFFPGDAEPSVTVSLIPAENWAVAWQDNFKPLRIGKRLLVTPPWLSPNAGRRETIIIEPAQAFGTGTHETTRACLELLEKAVGVMKRSRRPFSVLDVGCGSGILAIAAAKLGADPVYAMDVDPVAVEAARKNMELNGLSSRTHPRCAPVQELHEPADIVLANLDARTFRLTFAKLFDLSGRFLIISGIQNSDWHEIRDLFRQKGMGVRMEIIKGDWTGAVLEKKP